MPTCAILAPVLNRPHRVPPLVASLARSEADATIVFVTSPGDLFEEQSIDRYAVPSGHIRIGVPWQPGQGDWARKINHAFRTVVEGELVDATWLLLGSDDLEFHPGWLSGALRVYASTGACVIGTNDLHNRQVTRGLFSTHPLVHRDYLACGTIDEPGKVLHEGYDHNFPDQEVCATARSRGTWAFAADSHVEHLHPNWNLARDDSTYRKGLRRFRQDMIVFRRRQKLWGAGR